MARVTLGPDERIALHVMIRAIARTGAIKEAAESIGLQPHRKMSLLW